VAVSPLAFAAGFTGNQTVEITGKVNGQGCSITAPSSTVQLSPVPLATLQADSNSTDNVPQSGTLNIVFNGCDIGMNALFALNGTSFDGTAFRDNIAGNPAEVGIWVKTPTAAIVASPAGDLGNASSFSTTILAVNSTISFPVGYHVRNAAGVLPGNVSATIALSITAS